MRFTVAGSRIICSREDNTVEGAENAYRHVVEFDAHVDRVPPHVAARLTRGEVRQLREFLADRRRIRANAPAKNVLEAIPDLLSEAATVLQSVKRIDEPTHAKLVTAISNLGEILDNIKSSTEASNDSGIESSRGGAMRQSEALKERLAIIRRDL
jgi:hypothetical protein